MRECSVSPGEPDAEGFLTSPSRTVACSGHFIKRMYISKNDYERLTKGLFSLGRSAWMLVCLLLCVLRRKQRLQLELIWERLASAAVTLTKSLHASSNWTRAIKYCSRSRCTPWRSRALGWMWKKTLRCCWATRTVPCLLVVSLTACC